MGDIKKVQFPKNEFLEIFRPVWHEMACKSRCYPAISHLRLAAGLPPLTRPEPLPGPARPVSRILRNVTDIHERTGMVQWSATRRYRPGRDLPLPDRVTPRSSQPECSFRAGLRRGSRHGKPLPHPGLSAATAWLSPPREKTPP